MAMLALAPAESEDKELECRSSMTGADVDGGVGGLDVDEDLEGSPVDVDVDDRESAGGWAGRFR